MLHALAQVVSICLPISTEPDTLIFISKFPLRCSPSRSLFWSAQREPILSLPTSTLPLYNDFIEGSGCVLYIIESKHQV